MLNEPEIRNVIYNCDKSAVNVDFDLNEVCDQGNLGSMICPIGGKEVIAKLTKDEYGNIKVVLSCACNLFIRRFVEA